MQQQLQLRCVHVGLLQTNCYLLWQEGREDCLVIDPGAEPERIRTALDGKRIAAILLTHGHFDHIGGVDGLMDEGVQLLVHEVDAPMLRDPALNASWMIDETITCHAPTRTLREGDELDLAGIHVRVLHTPGHTAGGACYQAGDYLFTGDTMFDFGYGRTDLPTGDEQQLMQSLRRLAPLRAQYTILGGHS